ncbi:MAG: hypothetical protein KKC71_06500 [Chloroflexi bacterium]|nr:hypothetical protein [Chloroflexota bacterium]
MTTTNISGLLDALREHAPAVGQLYSISVEDVAAYLKERPDLAEILEGLEPGVIAWAIFDAIGEIGILEMVEEAIRDTILAAATQPEPGRDDPMDGDHASALASAGHGMDEDYGCYDSGEDS